MLRIFGGLRWLPLFILASFSQSTSYQLQNYNLGSGGTNNSSSATYSLNASTGEVSSPPTSSATRNLLPSSIQAQQANVPAAPTLSNGSNTFYNKLGFILNINSDPTDYTYAVAVSTTSNFTVTNYVQSDGTLGATQQFRSYSAWGSSSGSTIVGLQPNTTYYVKVSAMQGKFTNSAYGPSANLGTVSPSLTFTLSPSIINLGSLLAGSVITGGTNVSITYVTNAASGGNVYIASQNNGLHSTAANNTISAISADLSLQSQGFGAVGVSSSQTSGGPLTIASPFNGSSNNVGAPTTTFQPIFTSTSALAGGTASASIKAKAAVTTPAGQDYQEIITFVAAASF